MSNREAMTIFENIESPDYEDGQKMLAIKMVIKMLLYNSVSPVSKFSEKASNEKFENSAEYGQICNISRG